MSSLENQQKTVAVKVRPPPEKDGLHGGRTLSRVYMSRDTLLGMEVCLMERIVDILML